MMPGPDEFRTAHVLSLMSPKLFRSSSIAAFERPLELRKMDSTDSLSDGKSPIDSASTPVENAPNGNASAGARLDDAKTSTPLPKDGHVSYALPAQSSTSKSPSATVSNPILVNKRSKEEKKKKKKGKRKGLRDDVPAPTSVEELQARLDEQPEDAWLYDADVQAEESLELDASGEDTAWEHRDGTSASSFVDNHAESVNIPMAQFDHGVTFARTQTMASIGSGPESLLKRRDTIAFIPNGFLPHVPGAAPGLNLLDEELLAEKQAEGLVSNSTDRPESVASASSPINVTVTSYTPTDLETQHFTSLGLFESFLEYTEDKDENLIGNVKPVRWIHVEGIDLALLRALALRYGLHPLAIEDLTTFPPHVKLDFCELLQGCGDVGMNLTETVDFCQTRTLCSSTVCSSPSTTTATELDGSPTLGVCQAPRIFTLTTNQGWLVMNPSPSTGSRPRSSFR